MLNVSVRHRLAVAVVALWALALFVGAAGGQAAGKPTASALLQTTFADASAGGSVHEVEVVSGNKWFKAADDVSLHHGQQHITRSDGTDADVLLLGPVAFVSGNQQALVTFFGLPRSVAQKVGVRWIRIPSSDHGWYPTVAADATLPSALGEVKPSGHLVELPAREFDGVSALGIRGSMPKGFKGGGTDTILFTRSAHPMLVAAIFAASGQTETMTFSHWGERVPSIAPTDWIASSKL